MAHAGEFRYRYVSLDDKAPPGFDFFSPGLTINEGGRVVGSVYNCEDDGVTCFDHHVAIYKDGVVTVLQPGTGDRINAGGTIGGTMVLDTDPFNFRTQATLFRGNNQVNPIPPQPGEFMSFIIALNDPGTALVKSFDASFTETNVLYMKGQATVLNFGPTITSPSFFLSLNNQGLIVGTTGDAFGDERGFRFDLRTGEALLLEPIPPDTLAWGVDINNRGNVLGYSFGSPGPYHERIVVWDRQGNSKTYIDETIVSNRLVFNDNNLIVITSAPGGNSYLVPKPGVRLNLADLVENLPLSAKLPI
jgi:hypothetical protein